MTFSQSLDDILLGARIAFEGYRITIPEEVKLGARLAWEQYPLVKRLREMKVKPVRTDVIDGLQVIWGGITTKAHSHYVCLPSGKRIGFDSPWEAVSEATHHDKCWIEDNDNTTLETILFVVRGHTYHNSPWKDDLLDKRVVSKCGAIGRLRAITKDEFFGKNLYCAKCFPTSADIRSYITIRLRP